MLIKNLKKIFHNNRKNINYFKYFQYFIYHRKIFDDCI